MGVERNGIKIEDDIKELSNGMIISIYLRDQYIPVHGKVIDSTDYFIKLEQKCGQRIIINREHIFSINETVKSKIQRGILQAVK